MDDERVSVRLEVLDDDKWKIFLRDVRMFLLLYVLVKVKWDEK